MIEGTLTFVAGDQRFTCEAGANWDVPSGVAHTFRVESETAKLVAGLAPAGMDHCFRNAGVPADSPTLPPPDAPTRPFDELEAILAAHSHHNVGPPLGPDD